MPAPVEPEPAPAQSESVVEAPAEETPTGEVKAEESVEPEEKAEEPAVSETKVEETKEESEKTEEKTEEKSEQKSVFKKPKLEKTEQWQLSKDNKDRLLYAGGIFLGMVFVLVIIAIIISVLPFCNRTCTNSLPVIGALLIPAMAAGTILLSWFAFNKVNKKELKKEPLILESGKPSLETFTEMLLICYGVSFGVSVIPQIIFAIIFGNMCRAEGFGTCGLTFKIIYYVFLFTLASASSIILGGKVVYKKYVSLKVVEVYPNGKERKQRVAPLFVRLATIGASVLAILTAVLLVNYYLYS